MDKFMKKYSFLLTSLLGVIAVMWLVIGWNDMDMLRKLPIIYIAALAVLDSQCCDINNWELS